MKAGLLLSLSVFAIAIPDRTGHFPVLSIEAGLRFNQDPSDPARTALEDFKWSEGIPSDSTASPI
ncbi:MAG: hypothetical protein WCH11_01625, partial [Bdellovibrio sp.]